MRLLPAVAVLAVLALACQPEELSVGERRAAVVGGSLHAGDPSAVGILLLDSAENIVGTCSGTLITPRVVLTAGHCVGPDSGATKWAVYFGSTFNWLFEASPGTPLSEDPAYLGLVSATASTTHPGYRADPLTNDIALLQIEGVGPTTPVQIARSNPSVGASVRLVGFGNDVGGTAGAPDGSGSGDKRLGTSALTEVYADVILYGTSGVNTCQGDSGGPNYLTEGGTTVVAGVTSFGDGINGAGDSSCNEYGAGTNVATYTAFIDSWVRDHDTVTCGDDGACATGCAAIDSDCPCADDGFCTAACPVVDGDPDCPAGCRTNATCVTGCPLGEDPDCSADACADNGTCNPACEADPDCGGAGGAVGSACRDSGGCESGQCIAVGGDPSTLYCTGACDPGAGGCPDGMGCQELEGGGGTCVYERPPAGGVGAPCGGAGGACNSGACLSGVDVCTAPCTGPDTCPWGMACEEIESGGLYCLPGVEGPGAEPENGDCAVVVSARGGSSSSDALVLIVAGVGLMLARARRRRR